MKKVFRNGEEASLPLFNELANEIYEVKLCSKGGKFSFTIESSAE